MAKSLRVLYLFPLFLILYEFTINMSNDMYIPAMPELSRIFGASSGVIAFTITTWLLGDSSVQLLLGPLSDKRGRRPVIFIGGIVFIIATLICGLATSIWVFLVARFFQGMAVASLMVAGYAAIHEEFEEETAIHILSYMGCAAVVAPMIGPMLGGFVLMTYSWRMIFYVLVVLAILSLLGLYLVMPETNRDPNPHALHPKSMIEIYRRILRTRGFLFASLPAALIYSGIIVWIAISPFLLIEELHINPETFGFWQIPIFASYIIGAQVMKSLTSHFRPYYLCLIGLIIALISTLFFFAFSATLSLPAMLIPMCGYACGGGFASAPLTRISMTSTEEKVGAVSALFYLKMAATGSLMSFIAGLIYSGSHAPIALLLLAITLLAATLHLLSGNHAT